MCRSYPRLGLALFALVVPLMLLGCIEERSALGPTQPSATAATGERVVATPAGVPPIPATAPPSQTPALTAGPRGSSGIEGLTEADPQCPIVLPGQSCPPKRISATVAVLNSSGNEVARFTSGSDGSFRIPLPPGTYMLVQVVAQPGSPPSLKPVRVTVPPGLFVDLALLFDTGIR